MINFINYSDKTEVLIAAKILCNAIEHASEELKSDEEFVKELLNINLKNFEYCKDEFKDNFKFVLELIMKDGSILEHVSNRLKDNKEVVLVAVKQNGFAIEYASERLKNDKEVVSEAVRNYGLVLINMSLKFRNNKNIVKLAIDNSINGSALFFAEKFRGDKQFVLSVVKHKGLALEYTTNDLKNDKEVVLEAIKDNTKAIKYASEDIKKLISNGNISGKLDYWDVINILEHEIAKEKATEMAKSFNSIIPMKDEIKTPIQTGKL